MATMWRSDTCHCICMVETQELLVRCDTHTTYAQALTHNQTLNLRFGNLELPADFVALKFELETDRDAARRLNHQDATDILDKFDMIAADKVSAKATSTISATEQQNRDKLNDILNDKTRDKSIPITRQRVINRRP